MQSRGSHGFKNNLNASWVCTSTTCIWYIQGWNQRSSKKGRIPGADLEGGGGVFREGGSGPPPPLELSKYTSQRTTFQDFRHYQGVTLYAYLKFFGSLRSPVITSSSNESTCTMIRHYRSTILQIALEISWLCIVHVLSTPVQNNYFFCITPDIYSSTLQLKWKCQSTNVCTKYLQNSFKFSSFL